MLAAIFFIFGLVIGSFLNVCIYRLPRSESVVFPPSHCPQCSNNLKAIDLIPLISFVVLKGKCRSCQDSIPLRYPLVELLSGSLALLFYYYYWPQYLLLLSGLLFSYLLLVATFTDLEHRIIPDEIVVVGIVTGLLFSFFLPHITFFQSLLGLIVGGGSLLLVAIISRGGMGGGDIKLMAMMGSFLGWQAALGTIFLASLMGSIGGLSIVIIQKRKKGLKSAIPFGPYLSLAGIIVFFYGDLLWHWYLLFNNWVINTVFRSWLSGRGMLKEKRLVPLTWRWPIKVIPINLMRIPFLR